MAYKLSLSILQGYYFKIFAILFCICILQKLFFETFEAKTFPKEL